MFILYSVINLKVKLKNAFGVITTIFTAYLTMTATRLNISEDFYYKNNITE